MSKDKDAWLNKPQTTKELCRLYHGVDCHKGCGEITTSSPRSCNRHRDCDAADVEAKSLGRLYADHCHDECCEECFGY